MARLHNIPPKLHDEIVKKSGEGLSATKIKEWLSSTHQIETGIRNIQRLLKDVAEERKETAKAVYAEAVSKSANQDVEIIGEMISLFREEVLKTIKDDSLKAAKIAETLIKFQDRRMKLSGIDKEDNAVDDSLLDNLMEKLGK